MQCSFFALSGLSLEYPVFIVFVSPNRMKKYLLPALLMIVLGCSKNERANEDASAPSTFATPAVTPSQTVMKVSDALARHDSAAYINLVSASRRRTYVSNPQLLSRTLAFWAMRKPTIQVLSESQHDSVAVVKYRLSIAGTQPVNMTDSVQLFLENGAWKYSR
jgi:hypothetical protein